MTLLDTLINFMSYTLNVEFSLVNFKFCMLLTFPIGYFNYYIKEINLRLFYGLLTGLLLAYQMYGTSIIHIIITTVYTHLFMKFFGRRYSSFILIIINMIYLSFFHIWRMLNYNQFKIGVDTLYMMTICKFSSLAFAYEDGGKKDENINNKYWIAKKIEKLPSLFETFSYIFYFPSSLIGPSFEFTDFMNFINKKKEYENIPMVKCFKAAFVQFTSAILSMISFIILKDKLNVMWVSSDEFGEKSFKYKIIYLTFSVVLTVRTKYYTGFKLSEASIIFCGLGYNRYEQKDENGDFCFKEDFEKISNVDILKFEFDLNPNDKINSWNKSVCKWLKYQVFFRLVNLENKFLKNYTIASIITFITSAIWHGFFLGYYLTYIQMFFLQQLSKILENKFNFYNLLKNGNLIIRWIYNFFLSFAVSYFCYSFIALDFKKSIKLYTAFYYIPNFILLALYSIIIILGKERKSWKNNKTKEN